MTYVYRFALWGGLEWGENIGFEAKSYPGNACNIPARMILFVLAAK